jgi:hypothetical protein
MYLYVLSSYCSFHKKCLCFPVMYLYVLSSLLLISYFFFVLSCYVSVCSEFRVAHFFSFFVVSCYVSLCSEFRVVHFFSFFVLSCFVSLCSEFRVADFIICFCVVLLCIFITGQHTKN